MASKQDLSLTSSFRSAPFVGLRESLPSRISFISPFVQQLMRFISRYRRTDENSFEIEIALHEALANAIVHGNQEDPGKHVHVRCRCSVHGEVSITIEDEGQGFNYDAIPDPTSSANLLSRGRGVFLMKTLMDEVNFEQGGSVVHMRKKALANLDAAPVGNRPNDISQQVI